MGWNESQPGNMMLTKFKATKKFVLMNKQKQKSSKLSSINILIKHVIYPVQYSSAIKICNYLILVYVTNI